MWYLHGIPHHVCSHICFRHTCSRHESRLLQALEAQQPLPAAQQAQQAPGYPSRLSRPQDIRKAFWNRPGVIKKSWYM